MEQAQLLDTALRQLGVMYLNLTGAMERIAQLEAENAALRQQGGELEAVLAEAQARGQAAYNLLNRDQRNMLLPDPPDDEAHA